MTAVVGEALRVLIVEDSAMDVELVLAELTRAGFEVSSDVANSMATFLTFAPANTYDVVLADYRLPGFTGMDALAALRGLGSTTPLIMVTGTLGEENAVECVKQGATDYVLKQNLARLPIAIRRALAETRTQERVREAERILWESETRFRDLAENISEVFFVQDAQFRKCLYVSPAYEKIWGRSRESLYDNPSSFVDPLPPEDKERLAERIARIQRGEAVGEIEFRVLHPDGQMRWVVSNAVPIRNGNGEVCRISGIVRDVTEKRVAQLALEESLDRFRKLTEASFDAITITVDGIVHEANQGFFEMFGYERADEVVGRPVTAFVAEISRRLVEGRLSEGIEGSYEFVGKKKDNTTFLIEATAKVHTIGGRPARLTALRNISERRALEEQFRQSQKMEAVGRLAGGVAHDFNNLLTVISGYTEMLLGEMGGDDPRREDIDQIRAAANSAAGLTRQLLAFSRQQVIEPRVVTLEDVVIQSQKLLVPLLGEDIEVTTRFAKTPIVVFMDPGQLEQVIMNLAVNARDAMPTGGKLTIETAVTDLDERYSGTHWPVPAGRYAMLTLSDTGVGMDQQTRAKIFEPFFTTKEQGKGTGLGLATVYGIVKQSGGFIWVYSEPGSGTTFKLYFPLHAGKPESEADRAAVDMPRGTETVLIVEDSPGVRDIARRVLTRCGYRVIEAPSASAAQRLADGQVVHLLLTDVVMPEMSGRVLAERFAELHPKAKVLYMSGYTDDAIVRHGVLRAEMPYLQKPFTPRTLATRVRAVLDS